jgi:hypothetical protein
MSNGRRIDQAFRLFRLNGVKFMSTLKSLARKCLPRGVQASALLVLAIASGMALSMPAAASDPAHVRTGVSVSGPRIPATMIACFDEKTGHFVNKTKPADCDVTGYEGERGRRWVKTPVDGIKWIEWGEYRSRGAAGRDKRNGAHIRLFAYRRIRCGDGRTFYSYANVVNLDTGHFFYLRLPLCGDATPKS